MVQIAIARLYSSDGSRDSYYAPINKTKLRKETYFENGTQKRYFANNTHKSLFAIRIQFLLIFCKCKSIVR